MAAEVLNILTRTADRPVAFARCRRSVVEQTVWPDRIRHVVGAEAGHAPYVEGIGTVMYPRSATDWGHNLYLNALLDNAVPEGGWVMYLDDDDQFTRPDAGATILRAAEEVGPDTVIFWKVGINGLVVPRHCPGERGDFRMGDISGIGFAFHVKQREHVRWEDRPCADYFAIQNLDLWGTGKRHWINEVLTETQGAPGGGRRQDIDLAPGSGAGPPR